MYHNPRKFRFARLTAALESARVKENVLELGAGPPRYALQDFHDPPPAETEKRYCDCPSSHCASDELDRGQTFRFSQIKAVILNQDEWEFACGPVGRFRS